MTMGSYVLAFRGRPDRTPQSGEDAAWGAWVGRLGPAIADFGNRVGTSRTLSGRQGDGSDGRVLTGYIVINADDLDAAVELASGCPGLAHDVSAEVAEVAEVVEVVEVVEVAVS
jgi:hypothetical protein